MATILLIDDDPCFRSLVSTVISGCGHKLIEVSSVKTAHPFLAEGGIDLVILDGLLPDADGAGWLKGQRSRGMRLPVLFVSAFRKSVKDQQRIKDESGAQDFLAKPTTAPALLAKVERMLQKSAPAAEVQAVLRPEDLLILKEMEEEYAITLPGFVAGLKAALEQLRANPRDTALQGVARRRAHQIAGTAGSFGFAQVGDACAAIEDSVVLLQAGSGSNFAPVAKALAALCATPGLAA
jgi:DNA-binding response OmpR family regulator